MTIGLAKTALEAELVSELTTGADALTREQAQKVAQALASALEKNNQEIDRELGRRFANIERLIGR
jgi:hypothetical protein